MKHVEYDHLGQVMKCLNAQRKGPDKSLCDIIIEVKGQQFHAHRCVLVTSSDYFKTLFSSSFVDKEEKCHKLHIGTAEAMATILDFIYTGRINLSVNKMLELLTLSDYLLIPKIKEICAMFIKNTVRTTHVFNKMRIWRDNTKLNWVKILKIADQFDMKEVYERVIVYLEEIVHLVINDDRILLASYAILKSVLCNHHLNFVKEESLFELIVRWSKYKQKRKCYFSSLFDMILLEHMPCRYIDIRVSKEALCSQDKKITDKITSHIKSRKSIERKDAIVMFAGGKRQKESQYSNFPLSSMDDSKSNVIHILGYITQDNQWFNIGNLDLTHAQDASKTCSVETGGKIYIFVAGLFPIFACLDLADKNSIWHRLTPPMDFPYAHALAATESFVFALGDSGNMIKYCIATDKWETCTNCLITYPHVQNMVYYMVSHNNCLYAIVSASTFFYELSHFRGQFSLGEYDIENDCWKKLPVCNIPEGQVKKMSRLIFSVESEQNRLCIMQEHGRQLAVYDINEEKWVLPKEKLITTPNHLMSQEVDQMVFLKNNTDHLYLFSAKGAYPGMDQPGTPTLALFDCSCGYLKMKATPPFRYHPHEVSICATRFSSEVLNGFMLV